MSRTSPEQAEESAENDLKIKEAYAPVLEEMWRLGFLADETEMPAEELKVLLEHLDLETRLEEKLKQHYRGRGGQKRESRTARTDQSQRTRQEKSYRRRLAWHRQQDTDITHLGEKVSSGLDDHETDTARLSKQGLPAMESPGMLADAMGVSLSELRFLGYSRRTSRIRHYQQFDMPKKTGGHRRISTPMPRLKRLQYWILDNILNRISLDDAAHGFVKGRSIVTNAELHTNANIVVNLDLENFFPTITYPRVKGMFRQMGYSHQMATILALLCTEFEFEQVTLNDQLWYVGQGVRKLPQGAPTSPAISNIICKRLDRRLRGMAEKMDYRYSRYADDITFSTCADPAGNVQKLLWRCRKILEDEGFREHPDKTRIMRRHQQQHVTGLIVNNGLSIERKKRRQLRAVLHQLSRGNFEGRHWQGRTGKRLLHALRGYAHFMNMVDPQKGKAVLAQLDSLDVSAMSQEAEPDENRISGKRGTDRKEFRELSANGKAPYDPWWQAQRNPEPEPPVFGDPLKPGEQMISVSPGESGVVDTESASDRLVNERLDRLPKETPPRRGKGMVMLLLVVGVLAAAAAAWFVLR